MNNKINNNLILTENGHDIEQRILNKVKYSKTKKPLKIGAVYKITNLINNKIYIGSSKDVYHRWKIHVTDLIKNKHHSPHLQRAWNKYGSNNFQFEIIEFIDKNSFKIEEDYDKYLRERKQYYLNKYQSYKSNVGYNNAKFTSGGKGSYTFEDLHNGKCPFTEDQFWYIIETLQDPYVSVVGLARELKLKERYIQKIVDGAYVELSKEIFIPKRRAYLQDRKYDLEELGIDNTYYK